MTDGPGDGAATAGASAFEAVASRQVYDGVLSRVRVDTVRGPDGATFEREIVAHVDAVAVVAVTPAGDVVLVEQYRHAVGRTLLEIPAGICDVAGEDPAGTAARELAEETGYTAGEFTHLTTFHNSAGWSDEVTSVLLTTDVQPGAAPEGFVPVDEEAALRLVLLPVREALAAVRSGRITDAKTVIGLLLAAPLLAAPEG